MKYLAKLILLSLLMALLPVSAQAQSTAPAPIEYSAGPYRLRVTFDRSPLKSAQDFYLSVEQLAGPSPFQIGVQGVPTGQTSATPVKIEGDFDTTDPSKKLIKMALPISGSWRIQLTFKSQGVPDQTLGILSRVEPPPTIETWLAWLIGMSPIIGLIGFFLGQWRLVTKRRRAARQAVTPAQVAESVQEAVEERPPVGRS